jgi:hypothetical protein
VHLPHEVHAERVVGGSYLRADLGAAPVDGAPVDVQGRQGHRTVDVHGQVGDEVVGAHGFEVHEQHLGAVHREGGDHHDSTAGRRAADGIGEGLACPDVVMATIAVGRLDQQDVRRPYGPGGHEEGVLRPPEVAAEDDAPAAVAGDLHRHHRRAQDVPGRGEGDLDAVGHLDRIAEGHRPELVEAGPGLLLGVEGECGLVLREPASVGVSRLLLLQVPAVGEHDAGECGRVRAGEDRPGEPLLHEERDGTGVIDVRVGDHHRVDRPGVDREGRPVPFPQLLEALVEPAVDEHPGGGGVDEELAPRDGAGASEEGEHRDVGSGVGDDGHDAS